MTVDTHTALNRFGLGARPGEAEGIGDAQAWLLTQLDTAEPLPAALRTAAELDSLYENSMSMAADPASFTQRSREAYWRQAAAYLSWSAMAGQGFRERLANFWSNHFAISTDKPQAAAWGLPQSLQVIRPNLTGSFESLLIAAIQHPSMLIYLDNTRSIGPGSMLGARRDLGLNENLAREILELHTLGVDGGYEQADVEGLASALTGWTTGSPRYRPDRLGQFVFAGPAHQPGSVVVLGKRYSQRGLNQAVAILRDLARHPATATHLATKLATHFIADDPDPELVASLADVYKASRGNLGAVYTALIEHPVSWRDSAGKHRSPQDYLVATIRAIAAHEALGPERLTRSLYALGQPLWQPGSPAGWPDHSDAWLTPASLMARIEWTQLVAARLPRERNVDALARDLLGSQYTEHTSDALRAARASRDALALMLLSPEFQQR